MIKYPMCWPLSPLRGALPKAIEFFGHSAQAKIMRHGMFPSMAAAVSLSKGSQASQASGYRPLASGNSPAAAFSGPSSAASGHQPSVLVYHRRLAATCCQLATNAAVDQWTAAGDEPAVVGWLLFLGSAGPKDRGNARIW